jgi:cellulose synthase/poly-beta-1,6-N-acetylglucosamine synthase-like glycosyltransferase
MKEMLPLSNWKKSLIILGLVYSFWYFSWRWNETLHPEFPVYSKFFFALECIGFANVLMFTWSTWKLRKRDAPLAKMNYRVDVFIPTYNEDESVLKPAIYHAVNMDELHRTIVLDDGHRPAIRLLAESLGAEYRTRSDRQGAKAGNMNAALDDTDGDLIVVLDADGVPRKDFIRRLVGYFDDPDVALVQTPQTFYNLDSFQHDAPVAGQIPWTEQSLFFDICQTGRDYHDAAMCCGSGSIVRRSALDSVGRFPMKTLTEDLHLTFLFHAHGFQTVYHSEPLAYALAPSAIDAFVVQRARWALGSIQMMRIEWRQLFTNHQMTWKQRLSYFSSIYYLTGIQKTFFYAAPVLFLVFGISPVAENQMALPMVWYSLFQMIHFKWLSRGRGRLLLTEVFMIYTAFPFFKAVLMGLFPRLGKHFSVTPKGMKVQNLYRYAFPALLVSVGSLIGVVFGLSQLDQPSTGVWVSLVFSSYFLFVGLVALKRVFHRTISDKTYSFFDSRHARIGSVNGIRMDQSRLALATIFSDHSIRMVSDSSWLKGDSLSFDLCIPTSTLALSGRVNQVFSRKNSSLMDVDVELDELTPQQHLEFIRYAFEDVTTDVHFAQILEQEGLLNQTPVSKDQRLLQRSNTSAPIDLILKIEGETELETQSGVVVDCSALNAKIETKIPLQVDSEIELTAPWYGESVVARVIRCVRHDSVFCPAYSVAVEFDQEHVLFARAAREWGKKDSFDLLKLMPLQKAFVSTLLLMIAGVLYPNSSWASGELTLTPTYFSTTGQFYPSRVSLYVDESISKSNWSYSSWSGLGRTLVAGAGETPGSFTEWVTTQQDVNYHFSERVKYGAGFGYSASTSGSTRQYDLHVNLAVRLW